jgi:hypothetical protein
MTAPLVHAHDEDECAALLAAKDREIAALRKWLADRPTKPHPVDQLNNLSKALLEDAEAEVAALRKALVEVGDNLIKRATES